MTNLNGGTLFNAEFGIRHRAAPYRKGQVLHSVFAAARSGWENKNEIDVFSYISYKIRPEDLLILGKLVFPDFILDRGAVILEMNYEEKNLMTGWQD
ncbi:hypothetical protein [Pseudomonas aeruginosa]|uniref:hypothetical protein n=1 Tax=Pseudomonas aeruginosa TaxID=287 RepID=UPI003748E5D1